VARGGNVGGRGAFAEHLRDGVSGHEVDHQKHEAHDQPDDREGLEYALGEAGEHQSGFRLSASGFRLRGGAT
jgi:hypothetical protein